MFEQATQARSWWWAFPLAELMPSVPELFHPDPRHSRERRIRHYPASSLGDAPHRNLDSERRSPDPSQSGSMHRPPYRSQPPRLSPLIRIGYWLSRGHYRFRSVNAE